MIQKMTLILIGFAIAIILTSQAWASDMIVSGEIYGSQTYDSPEGILFDKVTIKFASDVTAIPTYQAILTPGTRVEGGAKLTVRVKDIDGLPNYWEMTQCQTLAHSPNEDPDFDELSMAEELQIGTNPCNSDTDDDGLQDGWEYSHGLNPLLSDSADDTDGDGLSDLEEYQAGTDLNDFDTDDDGLPDGWEVPYGLDPLSDDAAADADGDGFSNIFEYNMGSAPNDGNSKPATYLFNYDDNGNLDLMTQP